jgi:DMSO/TMAO reductase YedYZ molybdopterin-dependent catalytic subunit
MARTAFVRALCLAATLLFVAAWGCATEGGGEARSDSAAAVRDSLEIREYQGLPLDTFFRTYDNSIRGPQAVDIETYRLEIGGLVEEPQSLTYAQVLALEPVTKVITLYCVEGWKERLLFQGVRVADLVGPAKPKAGATTIIFHAVDGYSTSLPFEDVERLDLLLAAKINGRVLDEMRGFPFQLVAESKLGYKWIKWVNRIEISDQPYKGFWEQRGYSNEADVPKRWLDE